MNPITIVDTGICNISSVENAFKILGIETNCSNSAEIIDKSKILILPGVGAFKNAMDALKNNNLIKIIQKPKNINMILRNSDIAISSSGQSLIEFLYCGIPTIAMILSNNQKQNLKYLIKKNVLPQPEK